MSLKTASAAAPVERFGRGLVVGKFAPLHLGHEALVQHALARCEEVLVLSYTRPGYAGCGVEARQRWLTQRLPAARSIVLDEHWLAAHAPAGGPALPADDEPDEVQQDFLARLLTGVLGLRIDAMFASESYLVPTAGRIAEAQGAPVLACLFDAQRQAVPVRASRLREAPHRWRRYLGREVYADFVQRVCLIGGESTGKTTLAAALAERYGTCWVPEFGREWWAVQSGVLGEDDLRHIARTQVEREDALLGEAHQFLFCDTSPLVTRCYREAMFGGEDAELDALALRPYDQVLLCEPDFAFVQDGTRQGRAFRAWQHTWYEAALARQGVQAVHTLCGSLEQRIGQVMGLLGPPQPALPAGSDGR